MLRGKEENTMENYITPTMGQMDIVLSEDFVVWYVVAIAILALFAVSILGACVLYCQVKGKSFTGSWRYTNGGGSVKFGCK